MEQVILGENLKVSVLGFGGWAMGGTDWGPSSDEKSIEAVQAALAGGVTLFDTADFYGFGHGETILAKALEGADVKIASKGGLRWDGDGQNIRRDGSPSYLRTALENTLKRLNRSSIALYQLHWPDSSLPIEDSMGALMDFKKEGKIEAVGVCNLSPEDLAKAAAVGSIVSHQLPLSLLDRSALPAIQKSEDLGIPVIAYSPLGMGILTGKYVAEQVFTESDVRGWFHYFRGDSFRANIKMGQGLIGIAQGEGKTPGQVATRWALETPGVKAVLVGARRRSQAIENLGANGWGLSQRAKKQLSDLLEHP